MKGLILISIFVLVGCIKPPTAPISAGKYDNGLLVLCEGLFNSNNASLSYYSFEEQAIYNNVFGAENGRGLGDTANDMVLYYKDGEPYIIICVDISSQIEIVEALTLKSIAQIPMFNGTNAREPRRVTINQDASKAYVANFDGTVAVIDLLSNELIELIEVGANPDGITMYQDKIYVSNSGGLNFPIYDSTISVIDDGLLEVSQTYNCPINPTEIVANNANHIYLVSNGNYDDISPSFLKLDGETGAEIFSWNVAYSSFQIVGEDLFFYNADLDKIQKLNMITDAIDPDFEVSVNDIETFGGYYFDNDSQTTYLIDRNGYTSASEIHIINFENVEIGRFTVGLNANTIIKT